MLKRFFKPKVSARQLGISLYQAIQFSLSSRSELSIQSLIDKLELTEKDLLSEYETEIILALMYQVIFAVDNKYNFPVAGHIVSGMTDEFLAHAKEMVATNSHLEMFLSKFETRSKEYAEAEKNKTLYGPAFWIGKAFLENLTGVEQDIADLMSPIRFAVCSHFLTASLVGINAVLQKYKIENNE